MSMNCLASQSDPTHSGNSGPYFRLLNNDPEYVLSVHPRGQQCEPVTSETASSAATVLLVIDVPRSACTTWGTPCTVNTRSINSLARTPDSGAWTSTPTM